MVGEYLLRGGWSLYGNYAYTYGQNFTLDEPGDRTPPAQGIAGLRWRSPCRRRWFEIYEWIASRQTRLSARDKTDPRMNPNGTPDWHTLNLRMGTYLWHNSELSISWENILDRYYRVHSSGIDAPGITLILGYELAL